MTTARPLFQPLCIGKCIQLPNRFVMQPIYLNMESELGLWTDEHMAALGTFYQERARHGAKLIIAGGLGTSRFGAWRKGAMVLSSVDAAKALSRVTAAVHAEKGYILAQAYHAGRAGRKRFLLSSTSTSSPYQPLPTPPIRLPGLFVDFVVSEYSRFAALAEEAGFDGIEVAVSEGSLLHNFLSSSVNDRRDKFGGPLQNRLEIVIRVMERVKLSLRRPDDFAISLRLCLHDLRVGGTSMSETLLAAEMLAQSGYIDMLNTSVGMNDSPVQTLSSYVPQGTFARCCQLVRERLQAKGLRVPVVASHRIHSVAVAERLMERGICDLVGIARPLLADPAFIMKAEHDRIQDILPCIGCNHCVKRLYTHQRISCALNPIAGYERERGWRATPYKKCIAVAGAGPAGVTCALTLWRRGHDVTLFERAPCIGGQLNLAKVVPGKEAYQEVLEYWTRQLQHSSINVRLNCEFTREEVARSHQFFHAVVLTTGSIPRPITSHRFPGSTECRIMVPYAKILDGSVKAGRRVVLLGNGAIAHDVASFLLHDPRVTRSVDYFLDEWGVRLDDGGLLPEEQVVGRMPRNNRDVILLNKPDRSADLSHGMGWAQKQWIRQHGGTILKLAMIENICKTGVMVSILSPDTRRFFLECDTIIACTGQLPNASVGTWIYEWMKDGAKARGEMITDFGIYMAGSCRDSMTGEGRGEEDMLQAVAEGYEVGHKV